MELYKLYNPITATPFKCTQEYKEYAPCDALRPYIRCFWGSEKIVTQKPSDGSITGIITPDTCMDIMFTVDFTNNKIYDSFCGIDDRTFMISDLHNEKRTVFLFSIRFYAWGVPMFADESMKGTKNAFFDVAYYFSKLKKEIEPLLFHVNSVYELIPKVESVLMKTYNAQHENNTVLHAVYHMLKNRGNLPISQLKQELHISERQLERLFMEYVGVSPKSLASLVRYQYLWNDIVYNRQLDILDAVCKYGYSDQAHLCHDFKKYHSMNIADAIKYAMKNVGNIQENLANSPLK